MSQDPYTKGWLDCIEAQRPLIDHLQDALAEAHHQEEAARARAADAVADAAEAQLILRQTHQAFRTGADE